MERRVGQGWHAGLAVLAALMLTAACSDDDASSEADDESASTGEQENETGSGVDGSVLVEPFHRLAAQISEDAGPDEDEAPALDACPVMTDQDAVAIAEVIGIDGAEGATADGGRLRINTDEEQHVTCGVMVGGEWSIDVMAGITAMTPDDVAGNISDSGGGHFDVIEGEAPGLDPDDVVGITSETGLVLASWVNGGFSVTVMYRPADGDTGAVFEALPLAVEAAAASLG